MNDITLVLMPFSPLEHPSIALGLLKSALLKHSFKTMDYYANIMFAEEIGLKNYQFFSACVSDLLISEWLFSKKAFPQFQAGDDVYLERVLALSVIDKDTLLSIRNTVDSFIDRMAESVLREKPKIVGCSSIFQQHCASLAILRRIHELDPGIITILGGANCEGSMGSVTHSAFPWVDYVVSGEGDVVLPELCEKVMSKGRNIGIDEMPGGVIGPCHRSIKDRDGLLTTIRVDDVENLPIPDYEGYFDALDKSAIKDFINPGLLVETSRGCWWGQKHPCTFCSLNGKSNRFRTKSPAHIIEEFSYLSEKYHCNSIEAVDNIMDMKFFETLLPELSKSDKKYNIIFETKSNLKKEQVKQLASAGVRWIQAGIESLHDGVLKLLNKGNNAAVNIQLLKWTMEYGVNVIWNLLVKVPGESDAWYTEMSEWLPLIYHLQPPNIAPIRLDRFSRYFNSPEQYGLKLEPYWAYSYVYPLAPHQMKDFAYFFENPSVPVDERPGLNMVISKVAEWQSLHFSFDERLKQSKLSDNCPVLEMRNDNGRLLIHDTRPCAVNSDIILEGNEKKVYELCESSKTMEALILLNSHLSPDSLPKDVEKAVEYLVNNKLLLNINNRFLSLAVNEVKNKMPKVLDYPGGVVSGGRVAQKKDVDPFDMSIEALLNLKR